jgi:tetratricopeptide (TPR) repeat protein
LFDDSFEQVEVQRSRDVTITLRRRSPTGVLEDPVIGDAYRVNLRQLAIPRAALHHYKRAMALLKSGNDEKAILQLQRAIQIAPDFVEALYPLVDLFCEGGRYLDAEHALAQGISAAPAEVRLHLMLAKVLVRQHKYSGALAEVDKYLENLSKDADREAVQEFRAKLSSRASISTETK